MRELQRKGLHVLVDGQFGSTGKGLFASYLAQQSINMDIVFDCCVSNAGPNSGHTFYRGDRKVVLRQLPSFSVYNYLSGYIVPVVLSAGAVIDKAVLKEEANLFPDLPIYIHPNAVVISEEDVLSEQSGTIAKAVSTMKGTGAAIARKIMRDPSAVAKYHENELMGLSSNISIKDLSEDTRLLSVDGRVFMEISQGFSLGINSKFYPNVTSRECTVAQGISDASLSPKSLSSVYMVIRTFPIRIANNGDNSSGGYYGDQDELSWSDIGVEPELTTVTKKPRRIFSYSHEQVKEAIQTNSPDVILINFANYLKSPEELDSIVRGIVNQSIRPSIYIGSGPMIKDVKGYSS